MKKMFLFLGLAVYAGNLPAADTCPSGFNAVDDYIQIADNDNCATYGEYVETDAVKIVADTASCGGGYTEYPPAGSSTPDVMHGYCDTNRGSCKSAGGPYESNCS
jgi:hypothetical protein